MRKIALVLAMAVLSLGAAAARSKQQVIHAGTDDERIKVLHHDSDLHYETELRTLPA
jgi:hypothetical protein